jgi:hypothetical protein
VRHIDVTPTQPQIASEDDSRRAHPVRIFVVNQFYPPDMAPTGQRVRELARCLVVSDEALECVPAWASFLDAEPSAEAVASRRHAPEGRAA